jgi:hypothetical protein
MWQWWQRKLGRQQAEREIGFIVSGYKTAESLFAEPDPRVAEAGGRTDLTRAYAGRWYDEGYRDAAAGKSRSALFSQPDYDAGWFESMERLQANGFRHEILEDEYHRLAEIFK